MDKVFNVYERFITSPEGIIFVLLLLIMVIGREIYEKYYLPWKLKTLY